MSQVKKTGPQFDQGGWGAGSTKANGSHLTPASDVTKQGPTGSPNEQYRGFKTRSSAGGAATGAPVKNVPSSPQTAVRGGGGINGHSRDPAPKSSGSKNQQHPNVNAKNGGASGTYLGK